MADAASPLDALSTVEERAVGASALNLAMRKASAPFVVRGLARDWPLVRAGIESDQAARDYLVAHARNRDFDVCIGAPGNGERLFYDERMAMNFRQGRGPLKELLDGIAANADKPDAPVIYLSSVSIPDYFVGLGEENALDLGDRRTRDSIWIGGRTRIAAHNDVPDNLAVCAVGRRRFTLFPPEQFENLYLGPLENTPAGRPVSMVDFADPDPAAFPRFSEALDQAVTVVLEPGDALHIPSLWYHHVEGLAPFNVLVNYWWRDVPAYLGHPEEALYHAILAVRDLPPAARARWKQIFDHYVFGDGERTTAHLPEGSHGILAPLDAEHAGRIRAFLLRGLSR